MKRRGVLAGVAAVAVAGCLSDDQRPSEVTGWTPETGVETDRSTDDDPLVEADRETATVTVEGRASHPGCGSLELRSPGYDPEEAVLTVSVGVDEGDADCDEAPGSESYRVTVEFDEGVPATVVAREEGDGNEATVEFE